MEKILAKLPLRIDWSDLDLFGHVNNIAFFRYIQSSRVNFWEMHGFDKLFATEKKGPLLAASSCTFKKPLQYPGNLIVEISVSFVKNTSFGLKHFIKNDTGEIAAEADDVIVYFDYIKNEKIPLSETIKHQLQN